ncbi:MAG: META domain-containing protein [Chloroflexota bacterium]
MHTPIRAALAAILATTLLGAALPAAAQDADPALLVDVSWPLVALDGAAVPAAAAIDATFAADGSLSGSAGCNRFMGSYTLDGATIAIAPLATTRMACDPDTMAREAAFLDLLQAASTWTTDGRSLSVATAAGGTLVFGELAAEVGLVGTTGQLAALGLLPLPMDTPLTATFHADGTASGNAGCNDWFGPWAQDGAAGIAIGPLAATRKACDALTMQRENAFLTALEVATTWRIEDGTLFLTGGTIAQDLELRAVAGGAPGTADDFAAVTADATWTVIALAGEPVFSDDGLTLRFLADGSYDGNGGCNMLMGTWSADGAALSLSAPGATKMACEAARMELEAALLAFLPTVGAWSATDGELVLSGAGGDLRLVVDTGAVPAETTPPGASAVGIVGATWVLTELNGTPIPSALVRIGMTFAADGTLSGNGGCSDFTGTWSVEETTIGIAIEGGATDGCETSLKEFQEGMLLLLPLVDSWSIDPDGSLHLDSSFGVQSTWSIEG